MQKNTPKVYIPVSEYARLSKLSEAEIESKVANGELDGRYTLNYSRTTKIYYVKDPRERVVLSEVSLTFQTIFMLTLQVLSAVAIISLLLAPLIYVVFLVTS